MDQLIRLSEREARRRYVDSRNCRSLFRLLLVFSLAAIVGGLTMIATKQYPWLLVTAVNLVVIRLLYLFNEHPAFTRNFRTVLVVYFLAQAAMLRVLAPLDTVSSIDPILPLFLLAFRLGATPLGFLLGVLWASTSGQALLLRGLSPGSAETWAIAAQSVVVVVVFFLVRRWTEDLEFQFLDSWRRESRRWRERQRMREELGDARKIQLSMLPDADPKLPWLDVAGISIPASEVGGDYYDYFQLSETRLVTVVADVAGHGVASGLVLSGIRSCLHLLLQDGPPEPVEVLSKLDLVVRQTSGRRHFVTMIYLMLDLEKQEATVASAAHPPLLHFKAAENRVDEYQLPSLPLGTPLRGTFHQQSFRFESDDVLLLSTDGIAEIQNRHEEVYGAERLGERLGATAARRDARAIREILLGDVVTFKGDREQTDDITVVVLKVR